MRPETLRTWCEVDLDALRHNAQFLRALPGCGHGFMAVVKANAYGHGLLPVAQTLATCGAKWFGVANLEEALSLRRAGLTSPIQLLSAALPSEIPEIVRHGFTFTWSSKEDLRAASRAATQQKRKANGFLKVDTGMGRLGCFPKDTIALLRLGQKLPGLHLLGLATHYANADEDPSSARTQQNIFAPFTRLGFPYQTSNSAATLLSLDPAANFARLGLALYGCSPIPDHQTKLRPVLSWRARITTIRTFPKGWPISYGSTYRTRARERIAVLSVGYGDGYLRALSGHAHVIVAGRLCPIRGRVTMDQIMVDISQIPAARLGMPVTLIGQERSTVITAHDLANWAGTIPYEVLTHIQGRVARRYSDPSSRKKSKAP